MKRITGAVLGACLLILVLPSCQATTIFWSFLTETGQLTDRFGEALSAGEPDVVGDGDLLELLAWVGDDIEAMAERILGPEKGFDAAHPERGFDHPNYELLATATVGDGLEGVPEENIPGRLSVRDDVEATALEDEPLIVRFWDESLIWYNEVYNLEDEGWRVPGQLEFTAIDPSEPGSALVGELLGRDGRSGDDLMATIPIIPEPGLAILLASGTCAVGLGRRRGSGTLR